MSEISPSGDVIDTRLADALSERYLAYALSTIMSRSLPDVRDGLKPVHRRLLFAMRQLKLDPKGGFKKCARVVGDVIGKYHPHGDAAVYETLVRLAQDFSVRYPLVDGQGNFGNVDGDNAAAMRYTESRLTEVAEALLQGIDEDAVDFRETYDGEESEPCVLPAAFPNLLANGSSGIAVGMATNIPPHNADELCSALLHLIKTPNVRFETLAEYIPGPDFPTGGVMMESRETVIKAYETGRGSFRVRAKWEIEKMSRGLYQIIVTEIPYQVQKAKLIERVAELLMLKKLPLVADIRDESTDIIRLVIEPKNRTVEPEVVMEQLFKLTDLENKFGLNMNVLDATNTPRVMDLREVLQAFLDHRHEVLIRRSKFRLNKIEKRLEVLGGYLIAYLNLDEVIRIIREEDEPKKFLIKAFELTENQAEAIQNSINALKNLPVRGLVTLGMAMETEKFDVPVNVKVVNSVKHSLVFPHASAVVTHAGHGTIIRAFANGVPLVCMPMGRDQNDNAIKVELKGAGIKLSAKAEPRAIKEAVTKVLNDTSYRTNANRMKQELAAPLAMEAVLDEMEDWFAEWRKENPEVELQVTEGPNCEPNKACD